MSTVVWSTNSVDTSAILLAQALDAEFTKKQNPSHPSDDTEQPEAAIELLTEEDTKVIFYGIVNPSDWFLENHFDSDRIFNNPQNARALLNRLNVMDVLRQHNLAKRYARYDGETSYSAYRSHFHTASLDLITKSSGLIASVSSGAEFNAVDKQAVYYICPHRKAEKTYRVFLGHESIVENGIIGALFSENRQLTYRETLKYNRSAATQCDIDDMFDNGLISEEDGQGKCMVAWTEEEFKTLSTLSNDEADTFKQVGSVLFEHYGLDFCAVDVIKDSVSNSLLVVNATSCPSLQKDSVLSAASDYFGKLIQFGRQINKESFMKLVEDMNEDQIKSIVSLLKQQNLLSL